MKKQNQSIVKASHFNGSFLKKRIEEGVIAEAEDYIQQKEAETKTLRGFCSKVAATYISRDSQENEDFNEKKKQFEQEIRGIQEKGIEAFNYIVSEIDRVKEEIQKLSEMNQTTPQEKYNLALSLGLKPLNQEEEYLLLEIEKTLSSPFLFPVSKVSELVTCQLAAVYQNYKSNDISESLLEYLVRTRDDLCEEKFKYRRIEEVIYRNNIVEIAEAASYSLEPEEAIQYGTHLNKRLKGIKLEYLEKQLADSRSGSESSTPPDIDAEKLERCSFEEVLSKIEKCLVENSECSEKTLISASVDSQVEKSSLNYFLHFNSVQGKLFKDPIEFFYGIAKQVEGKKPRVTLKNPIPLKDLMQVCLTRVETNSDKEKDNARTLLLKVKNSSNKALACLDNEITEEYDVEDYSINQFIKDNEKFTGEYKKSKIKVKPCVLTGEDLKVEFFRKVYSVVNYDEKYELRDLDNKREYSFRCFGSLFSKRKEKRRNIKEHFNQLREKIKEFETFYNSQKEYEMTLCIGGEENENGIYLEQKKQDSPTLSSQGTDKIMSSVPMNDKENKQVGGEAGPSRITTKSDFKNNNQMFFNRETSELAVSKQGGVNVCQI